MILPFPLDVYHHVKILWFYYLWCLVLLHYLCVYRTQFYLSLLVPFPSPNFLFLLFIFRATHCYYIFVICILFLLLFSTNLHYLELFFSVTVGAIIHKSFFQLLQALSLSFHLDRIHLLGLYLHICHIIVFIISNLISLSVAWTVLCS